MLVAGEAHGGGSSAGSSKLDHRDASSKTVFVVQQMLTTQSIFTFDTYHQPTGIDGDASAMELHLKNSGVLVDSCWDRRHET